VAAKRLAVSRTDGGRRDQHTVGLKRRRDCSGIRYVSAIEAKLTTCQRRASSAAILLRDFSICLAACKIN